jgi:hypothetical protein
LNYASTSEEIEQFEYGFVNEHIINDLIKVASEFDSTERFVFDLLYHYVNEFSITLPMLWIGKVISDELFVDAYRVFVFEQPLNPNSKKQKEQREYFINRIKYLRKALDAIKKVDSALIK